MTRDKIDERNLRDLCSRGIIKGYNVHYMTPEEAEWMQREAEKGELNEAGEINRNKDSGEGGPLSWQEPVQHENYGERPSDEQTKKRIDKILCEKEDALSRTIDNNRTD